ncbi:Ecm19p KNAG_0B06090 [Huiozyma naganishii CBS 8797]|uniref:Uncharacterized protein n=1 Tax=Huiozyma naganishii (strain ATCC MYA-139 / BCRC 22969 / CBS 8797 / KCTC 17520 / NBRC 10181 / NCYC 3082 / Yp74L-3) TaxID=1071383 RepID=J7S429_HUIN7|nr:hypothetical protein KNAG_0B06090 [Kazachstania naganishii CBS 8797]CCK69039.1 hypothetical protein KNAG_0B06090 [Kazachstania naganishii CBS 8797]
MARIRGYGNVTVGVLSLISIYMGVNFFQPIVIEQLRKDGHLRQDMQLPHYDSDGKVIPPGELADAPAGADVQGETARKDAPPKEAQS